MSLNGAAVPPSHAEGGAAPQAVRRVGEFVFAGLIIALGIWALFGAFTINTPAGSRVGPTVFPIFVGALLLCAGAAVFIGVVRGRVGTPEESEDTDPNASTDWLTMAKIAALVVAELLLMEPIGWVLSATLLFGGIAWALGTKRWWLGFVVGFVVALVVQIVFGELLGLSLPLGPLFSWLGPLI